MSIVFFEGFETVGTETGIANQASTRPRINLRWAETASGGTPASDSFFLIDDIFSEGYAIQMGENGFSNGNYLQFTGLPTTTTNASAAEYIVGCRVHIPSTARTWAFIQVRSELFNNNHVYVNAINSVDVSVTFNLGGTFISDTGVFTPGTWHYVELRFIIGNAPYGEVELYIDGTQIGESVGVDTEDFYSHVDAIIFANTTASSGQDFVGFDDIYILEVDGTAPNDFLGPQARIISLPPDGDAGTNQWTPSTGTSHFAMIDENGADSSDYLEESTDTQSDMFTLTDTTAGGQFIAMKVEAEAIAITTTSHTLDVRIDSNSNVAETNHAVTSTTAYAVFDHYQATDPNTASAWTDSGIDAADVGIQFNT